MRDEQLRSCCTSDADSLRRRLAECKNPPADLHIYIYVVCVVACNVMRPALTSSKARLKRSHTNCMEFVCVLFTVHFPCARFSSCSSLPDFSCMNGEFD